MMHNRKECFYERTRYIKIIIAVLSILAATSFIFKFRKTKDSNNKNNINQNGISFTGDINQSIDNNVRKK